MARAKVSDKSQDQGTPDADTLDAIDLAFASGEQLETISGDGSKPLPSAKGEAGKLPSPPSVKQASTGVQSDTLGHPRDKPFPWEKYGPYTGYGCKCPKEPQSDVLAFVKDHTPSILPKKDHPTFAVVMQELAYELAKLALHFMRDRAAGKTSPVDRDDMQLIYAKRNQMEYWLRYATGGGEGGLGVGDIGDIGDERARAITKTLMLEYAKLLYAQGVRFPPSWFGGSLTG